MRNGCHVMLSVWKCNVNCGTAHVLLVFGVGILKFKWRGTKLASCFYKKYFNRDEIFSLSDQEFDILEFCFILFKEKSCFEELII
jgi:hypothetical protein